MSDRSKEVTKALSQLQHYQLMKLEKYKAKGGWDCTPISCLVERADEEKEEFFEEFEKAEITGYSDELIENMCQEIGDICNFWMMAMDNLLSKKKEK